jgi:hypothetical protein
MLAGLVASGTILLLVCHQTAQAEGQESKQSPPPKAAAPRDGILHNKYVETLMAPFVEFYDLIRSFIEGDNTVLMQPEMPDIYGLRPRTVVLGLEKSIIHAVWTRDDGWRIRKRPHMDKLMNKLVSRGFEIVIWASGSQGEYEMIVLDVDADNKIPTRLYREHTNFSFQHFRAVKDLQRLGRDLRRVIVVDQDPAAAVLYPDNCIKLKPFTKDVQDNELPRIVSFIEKLQQHNVSDVRPYIKRFNENPDANHFEAEERMAKEAKAALPQDDKNKAKKSTTGLRSLVQGLRS